MFATLSIIPHEEVGFLHTAHDCLGTWLSKGIIHGLQDISQRSPLSNVNRCRYSRIRLAGVQDEHWNVYNHDCAYLVLLMRIADDGTFFKDVGSFSDFWHVPKDEPCTTSSKFKEGTYEYRPISKRNQFGKGWRSRKWLTSLNARQIYKVQSCSIPVEMALLGIFFPSL